MRSLFVLQSTHLNGAIKVLLELSSRLKELGQDVDVFVIDQAETSEWFGRTIPFLSSSTIEEAVSAKAYDFIFFQYSTLIPRVMPHASQARPVFICQNDERTLFMTTYGELVPVPKSIKAIMALPIGIISVSKALVSCVRQNFERNSYYVPIGIDDRFFDFASTACRTKSGPRRILMVGPYLTPFKGMQDGFAALERLNKEIPVQLVLITQENRRRWLFDQYDFPVEIHFRPELHKLPEIYASCHLYCSTSWNESFGLPAIEAMSVQTPVVCVRHQGLSDYGEDHKNLVVSKPSDPEDLYQKMKLVLSDEQLYSRLQTGGLKTATLYTWNRAIKEFLLVQRRMLEDIRFDQDSFAKAKMEKLTTAMIDDGVLPAPTHRSLAQEIRPLLDETIEKLNNGSLCINEGKAVLRQIKTSIESSAKNGDLEASSSPMCHSLRDLYDKCRLLIALEQDDRFLQYISLLLL